ncbi:MAG: hypothetical protein JNL88_12810 [Bacteroidia bacterium]|nr:hypothetical protein [Bacteroidia bacterium]
MLVAVLGVIMRYKIGFEFPYFEQKHLQNAHSHFAFSGWVSQALMVLLTSMIRKGLQESRIRMYNLLLSVNLITSVAMLITFTAEGYGPFSTTCSAVTIAIAFCFAFVFYRDLRTAEQVAQKNWFNAALLFNVLSTLGTAVLVYMMATGHLHQKTYLSAIYWYLHFQYNGWFFMACMGLFAHHYHSLIRNAPIPPLVFHLFSWSMLPTFGLSVLWLNLSLPLYLLVILGAAAQAAGWAIVWKTVRKGGLLQHPATDFNARVLFLFIAVSVTIKLLLQLASVHPELNTLVFGFRNIVIAYLHLILLAIITVALITFFYVKGIVSRGKRSVAGIRIFIAGIFLNEVALAVQGLASFQYIPIPKINELLFVIALVIWAGLLILLSGQGKKSQG